jgi:uncharacterized protein YoxC
MVKLRHSLVALFISTALASVCAFAQSSLTQIRDTIVNSDGTPFNGMVVITWNGFSVPSGTPVSQLSASATIYNGALSVLLVPTTTATAGTYYQVVYSSSNGTATWTETWQVPPSTTPLTLSQVRQTTTQGNGTGSTSGSTQYATLPIAISQVTSLSSSLSNINNGIAGLTTNVSGLTTSLNGLNTTVASNSSGITSLNSTVTTMGTTVSGLSTSVTNLNNTVAGLSATVNTLTSGGSGAVFVDGETPSGTVNGVNLAFTLSHAPSPTTSLALYRNGLMQTPGIDFTLSGSAITFLSVSTPQTGDILEAYYRIPGTGASTTFVDAETPGGTVNGTNLAFTLANAPNPAASLKLYKNGVLMAQGVDYTLSGSAITFIAAAAPQTSDLLLAAYRH